MIIESLIYQISQIQTKGGGLETRNTMKTFANLRSIAAFLLVASLILVWACAKKADPAPTPTPTPTPTPVTKSAAKDITKFSFAALSPALDAAIDAATKAITATVPAATDVTKLVPTITISDKATISPATGVAQDFSKEVSYTVTAEDASTVVYKMNVKKEAVSGDIIKGTVIFVGSDKYMTSIDGIKGTLNWKFELGNYGYVSTAATYQNGLLYFGSNDKLYALDANTGIKKWEFKVPYIIFSVPIVEKGFVYFTNTIGGKSTLYALDATTGIQKWTYQNDSYPFYKSNPTVVDSILYIGNSTFSTFLALDAVTGTKKWDFRTDGAIDSNPVVANGNVYFGSKDQKLYALDAKTGVKKWDYKSQGSFEENSPTISDGILYIGNSKELYAIDATTGTKKWSYPMYFTMAPYVSNGVVYAYKYFEGAGLIAINAATGTKKWEYGKAKATQSSPIELGGFVYISGSDDKSFYAIDANDGKKIWTYTLERFAYSPCIVSDNKVYHSSESGMQQ